MGPRYFTGVGGERWEVLRFETTVRSVCIWIDFFAYFLQQWQKVRPAQRLKK